MATSSITRLKHFERLDMNRPHHYSTTYRPEIDGLRAIAVLAVIFFHSGFRAFSGGFVGVDVFFVISGYLIALILIQDLEKERFSISHFYQRRARRILPALFGVTLICIPLAWIWMLPHELRRFGQSLVSVGTFSTNVFFWLRTDYFSPNSEEQPLLHIWSLAVEEQFYLIFPLLLALSWQLGKKTLISVSIAVALASLSLSEWMVHHDSTAAFYLIPTRAWELLAGVITAFWTSTRPGRAAAGKAWTSRLASWVGIGLITVAILTFTAHTPTPGLLTLAPVVGAVLVVGCVSRESFLGGVLSSTPIVVIGLMSYSLYLWHQPVLAFARLTGTYEGSTARHLLFVSLNFPLAYASWRFIEQPIRKGALSAQYVFLASAVGLAALCIIGGVVHAERGFEKRSVFVSNEKVKQYMEVKAQLLDWMRLCDHHRVNVVPGVPLCRIGEPTVEPDVVLWGDSYAGALLPGLDFAMREIGRSSLAYITNGCPPLPGLTIPGKEGCTVDVHTAFIDNISRLPKIKFVIWYGHMQAAMVNDEVRLFGDRTSITTATQIVKKTLATLHRDGKRVIFVEQGPYLPFDVPDFYIRAALRNDGEELTWTHDDYEHFMAPVLGLRSVLKDEVDFVDTEQLFCINSGCPGRRDEFGLMFSDRSHISNAVAKVLGRSIVLRLPPRAGDDRIPSAQQ
jgi:peptidoglycan/LPS O-acetylase OafA/YrhL